MIRMTVKLAQLYALKAQVEAMILVEEAEAPQIAELGSCPHCGASEDKVQDISTLDGTKRRYCNACRHEWTL